MKRKFNTIKKSRKKSKEIDEKIEYLNKECQKTGLQEVMNTTGMYSVTKQEPNPSHVAFTGLSVNGQPLGFAGGDHTINAPLINGAIYSPPHPVTGERRAAGTWKGILIGFKAPVFPGQPIGSGSDRIPGSIMWVWEPNIPPNGRWVSLESNNGQWCVWVDNAFGSMSMVPYGSVSSNLSNDLKNNLNNININDYTNPDDFGPPTNPVLFKNDLGDPNHLPINIPLSTQGFEYLKKKAKDLALFGFGKKTPKPIYYGGEVGEFRRQLQKDLELMKKLDPTQGGPGGVIKLSQVPEGDLLSEAVKLGHFDPEVLNVDINDIRKGIMPEFPKDPPEMIGGYSAKSRLVRKDLEIPPFIKVTRKDLAKNHLLTDKEIQDFLDDVKRINEYIKKNPSELIYAMTRYPKNDPRLAQLNFKMDEMKRASDQYVETHFPENVSLFNKLQNKIKQNIEMTNPDNFTGHKEAPKFSDDNVEMSEQKKKTVLKYFKKPVSVKKLFRKG